MATFVVCTSCGQTREIAAADEIPKGWRRTPAAIFCPRCSDANEDEAVGDVLDEEVIYPPHDTVDETLDEGDGYCEVCRGPCQGH